MIGDRLGLYRALAASPLTPTELAAITRTDERYVREWLASQAAGGYITYNPETHKFGMTEEQAFTLANEDGPAYLPGAFELALGSLADVPRITEAFRSGTGMGWGEHDDRVFHGCEKFFRPGYAANLVSSWIPALDGVQDKLARGAKVADVGCGKGASSILMAKAFPESRIFGFDYHTGPSKRRGNLLSVRAWRTVSHSRWRKPRNSPAKTTTSWRSSTASTTWEIRWALLRMSGRP